MEGSGFNLADAEIGNSWLGDWCFKGGSSSNGFFYWGWSFG
jgi:hypothetical protein